MATIFIRKCRIKWPSPFNKKYKKIYIYILDCIHDKQWILRNTWYSITRSPNSFQTCDPIRSTFCKNFRDLASIVMQIWKYQDLSISISILISKTRSLNYLQRSVLIRSTFCENFRALASIVMEIWKYQELSISISRLRSPNFFSEKLLNNVYIL